MGSPPQPAFPHNYKYFFILQNVYAPELDPEMTVVRYERTYEQNEELGLNDMRTENYSEGGGGEQEKEALLPKEERGANIQSYF